MMFWKRPTVALTALLIPVAVLALPWSDDMRDQPSIQPQQTVFEAPEGAVPTTGRPNPFAAPRDAAELVLARLEAADVLPNPVEADADSIERGQALYETHCQVCHGTGGRGDGPVGEKYVPTPINLTNRYIQEQSDGRIFYTITHGGVVMPFYRDSIRAEDRWHVVNYIKQGFGGE